MGEKIIRQVYVSGVKPIESFQKLSLNIEDPHKKEIKSNKIQSINVPKSDCIEDEKLQDIKPEQKQSVENTLKKPDKIFLTEDNFEDKKKDKDINKKSNFWARIKKIKNIEIYIAIAFVAIILLIYFTSNASWLTKNNKTDKNNNYSSAYDYCLETEKKLSKMLSGIKNAGKVDIMITFESTPERVIAYITSSTKNTSSGGDGGYNENNSNTSSPQVIYVSGEQIPLILKEVSPKVTGVLIVAEGADDVKVKLDIINAVSVLLNISTEQIKVLTMNKG
jgi:stage III sporulation protein AG